MALVDSMEKEGNWLFRHRGELPIVLFASAIPIIWLTDYNDNGPNTDQIFLFLSLFLSLSGFLIRAYTIGTTPAGTSGRNTEGQVAEALNFKGIYSIVRHPLYLGNYLYWIGIVLYTQNIYYTIIVSLAFWVYYERIMFAEERYLERKFGDIYMNWSAKVGAFLPSFGKYEKGDVSFSLRAVLRREYPGFISAVVAFTFVEALKNYSSSKQYILSTTSLAILFFSGGIATLLSLINNNTNWLKQKGRS